MNRKAFLLGAITIVLWSSSFAAIRASLLGGYTPGHLVLVRGLAAAALFVIYALWPTTKFRLPEKAELFKIGFIGFLGVSVFQLGVTFGEETVSAGTAGMLIGAAPIVIAILAVTMLNEQLSRAGWIGLFIGLIGITLITLGTEGSGFTISIGAVYILIAVVATSFYFVLQKPLLMKYRPIELTAYFTWAGIIPYFIFTPGVVDTVRNATLEANIAAIYVGVFPAAIAYALWATALSMGETGKLSSLMYVEPVLAIIIAWIWLKELPSTLSIIGGIIAISSVFIVNYTGKIGKKAITPLKEL